MGIRHYQIWYRDKIISDMQGDYKFMTRKTLIEYMGEWFLKRYGLYNTEEYLFCDFLPSLRTY